MPSSERKVDDLADAQSDMQNLLNSTDTATIFLDPDLNIKRFTPAARTVANLIVSDLGRPLSDIASKLEGPPLMDDAREVLQSLVSRTREIRSAEGSWYLMRTLPYRTVSNTIGGVILTFSDVTASKQAEVVLREAQAYFESIVQTVREPLVVLDREFRVVSANEAFYETFAITPADAERRIIYGLGDGAWDIPRLRELLEKILPTNSRFDHFEIEHVFPGVGRKVARPECPATGAPDRLARAHSPRHGGEGMRKPRARPRTEERQRLVHELRVQQLELERQNEEIRNTQRELEAERDRVADLYQLASVAHLTLDRSGTIVETTVLALALLGVDRRRLTRRRLHELVVPADWATLSRHLADVFAGTARRTCDLGILAGRDTVRIVRVSSIAVAEAGEQSTRCRTALMDITERKQAEEGLKDSRAQFESIVTSALDAIVTVSEDGRVVLMNPAAERMFGCRGSTAIGHAFDRFIQASSQPWYRAAIVPSAGNDGSGPVPGRLGTMVARQADGTEFPVEASISEVVGSSGRLFTVILRDVSARQRAERALAERLRLEQLVTRLAVTFGHLSTAELDQEVQGGLRAVIDFLEIDRGSLIEFSRDGKVAGCWAIEEWMDVGDFPWMTARLQRGDFVTVSRLDDLPDEAAIDRRSYLRYRVKPQIAVSLEAGGRIVGGLVFSTIGAERATSDELKQQLHLLGEVFANLLSRTQAERELQKLRQDLGRINRVATVGGADRVAGS